jgi:hypothetical protein
VVGINFQSTKLLQGNHLNHTHDRVFTRETIMIYELACRRQVMNYGLYVFYLQAVWFQHKSKKRLTALPAKLFFIFASLCIFA